MILSLSSVSPLPFFRSRRTCCSRSSIWADVDVVAVDLADRHRRVDGLVAAGVVAEVEEGPTQQQDDRDRGEGADDVLTVHRCLRPAARLSRVRPRPSDKRRLGRFKATARPTIDSSRRCVVPSLSDRQLGDGDHVDPSGSSRPTA